MRKGLVWTGGLLVVAFLAFAVWQYINARGRFEQNVDLVAELAQAEFLPAATVTTGDWPQWRGQHRDGFGQAVPLARKWPSRGPTPLWEVELGEGWSAPAVADGRVYFLFRNNGNEVVRCVDLADGKQHWQHEYPVDAGKFEYSHGPRSTPCLARGKLYTVGITGVLQCREIADGKLLWQKDFAKDYGSPAPHRGVAFSPLVEGDRLILNPGGPGGPSLVACNAGTGDEIWRAGSDPVGYSSPLVVTLAGQKVVLMFTGLRITGHALDTGRELFGLPWETPFQINAATPVHFQTRLKDQVRDYVFISSGYKKGCALVHLRPRQDGTFEPQVVYQGDQFCCHYGSPVRLGDHLYGFDDTRLACMNLRTGEIRWRKTGYQKGTLCALGDHLVVFGEKGDLGIGPANPDQAFEPTLSARLFRDQQAWTMPIVAQGKLLVRTQETALCIDLRGEK